MRNLILLGAAIWYTVEQNIYFGWNFFPKSDAELTTDGIALLLFAITFGVIQKDKR